MPVAKDVRDGFLGKRGAGMHKGPLDSEKQEHWTELLDTVDD
jgi:hypothetical protein